MAVSFPLNLCLFWPMFSPEPLIACLRERAIAANLWQPCQHARGSQLLVQGKPCAELLVLLAGLVKLTYLTTDGDEWIKSFVVDKGVFGALKAGSSRFGAVAIEPAIIVRLPTPWLLQALASDSLLAGEASAFNSWLIARKQAREEALLCQSAEERYRDMQRAEPRLLARLSQGDIARYLRVTPVAFSRIKRRMRYAARDPR